MIRQDYLLRLIEQAAQMLAKMLGLQASDRQAEAGGISRELAEQWLGLTQEQLRTSGDQELLEHLQRHGAIAEFPLRLGLAISLLQAEGARFAALPDRLAAIRARSTALCLLMRAHILNVAPELPDFTPRATDLLAELPFEGLPVPAAVLLMCYHEHVGQFSQAEDVLFALRQREGEVPWLRELGNQFYNRLKRHSDAALIAGNLPREEIEQGEQDWQTRAHLNTVPEASRGTPSLPSEGGSGRGGRSNT